MFYRQKFDTFIRVYDTIGYITNKSNDIVCGVCVSSLGMVANGNIYPCAGWQGYILGNIKENNLYDIWENSPRVKYLRSLRKGDFPECQHYIDKNFCSMCMVRNANENPEGNPLQINRHFCQVAALNRKLVLEWQKKSKLAYFRKIFRRNANE
jgi:radical SAM protein with 4Fe4S-binding SPASM domain